jgi:zinc resistance-associated protein
MRRDKIMRRTASKIFVVLTVFSIMGLGAYAFAGQETGYGQPYRGWGHHGPGWQHGEYGYPGYGYMMPNLSDEEIQKLDNQRNAFFKSTEDLRQQLYQKRLALESEFAKRNPDAKNAANLQKEISGLKAQIDQKRIEYLLEMKKINPAFGTGWMGGPGRMGYGYGGRFRGNGPMGYGALAGHPCWQ